MRADITGEYSNRTWKEKVARMPDYQVIAIYNRKLRDGSLRGIGSHEDRDRWNKDRHDPTPQMPLNEIEREQAAKEFTYKQQNFGCKPDINYEQLKFDI